MQQSGLYIPGDGKSLVCLKTIKEKPLLIAAQNQGPLLAFSKKMDNKMISVFPGDKYAEVQLADGKKRKEEFYFGSSFYSQSGRYLLAGSGIRSIVITDNKGIKRTVNF